MQTENLVEQGSGIGSKERFEFGKNWAQFLRHFSEERLQAAERSLREMLGLETLEGKSFLDVGSGSGLFSLAARRLGARVVSFDYDPESVHCALQLKRAFFAECDDWRIEQGSALDKNYLETLRAFDVVYSWGVLHHTGAMWAALENMLPLVKPGGKLVISIYNDQGAISRMWRLVKRTYNRLPKSLRFMVVWPIGSAVILGATLKDICRLRKPRVLSNSVDGVGRGMELWTDVIDWVGGYPFEVASREAITGFYVQRGFCLDRLISCGRKLGCNQYVFTKGD
jgi:2-polyprenyl-6-hydroxyphenyl methylase/3-demethylubiquinone-9 3-methyltransferase